MIVSCPACEARFQVERDQLGYDGRIVRCGKCGNCWHQMPEDDPRAGLAQESGLDLEAAVPPPPRRRAAMPPPKKSGGGFALAWLLLLLLVGGAVAGAWLERERIVEQFPQLADIYAMAGVPVTKPGPMLRLTDVTTQSAQVDGDTVITVRGMVSNMSDRKQTVPQLRAQLTNAAGTVLVEWVFDAPRGELDAGDAITFETETRNPPEGAQNLSISLAGSDTIGTQ